MAQFTLSLESLNKTVDLFLSRFFFFIKVFFGNGKLRYKLRYGMLRNLAHGEHFAKLFAKCFDLFGPKMQSIPCIQLLLQMKNGTFSLFARQLLLGDTFLQRGDLLCHRTIFQVCFIKLGADLCFFVAQNTLDREKSLLQL